MRDLEEGRGSAEEKADDAGEAAHRGEVEGGVAEGLAGGIDLRAITSYSLGRGIYWVKGFFHQMLP